MSVGNNLKLLREANGFTQEQLADFLRIKRSTYSNYELGEREAPLEILERVSDLFGVELYSFYEEDENLIKGMLTCAFRIDNVSENDMKQIADFKGLVREYLKLDDLLKR